MTNHPYRNKNILLLTQGCEIARAILADGSLTLIGDEPVHNGGVVVRQRAALLAVEHAMRVYNAGDHDPTISAYIDADHLRNTLREGCVALATRIKSAACSSD